jgi:type IV secretory pathway TrbD component
MGVMTEKTFTDLQRNAAHVASLAAGQDVHIRRRDSKDLLLVDFDREMGIRDGFEFAARLLQGMLATGQGLPLFADALTDNAPWTSFLTPQDRIDFLKEFTTTAQASLATGSFGPLGQLLREWQATAAVYADQSVLQELNQPPDKRPRRARRP